MQVTLVYFDRCPSWRVVEERLWQLADELGFELRCRRVATPEEAAQLGFRGSPTVLVDGRDPFAEGDEPVGLACRLYRSKQGFVAAPSVEELREALGG